jgi:hypothetical protein
MHNPADTAVARGDPMADAPSFSKLVPGFDFLQELVKNAGAALPHMGQWVAPTLDPAELEKRIEELRTVQFWLEQNARMLGATIQALEVQRMTLSTLKTMNVQMDDLRESMMIRPAATPKPAQPVEPAEPAQPADEKPEPAPAAPGIVDPMQWWGALTQQFTQLATSAMKESVAEVAKASVAVAAKPGAEPPAKPPAARSARKAAPPRKRASRA